MYVRIMFVTSKMFCSYDFLKCAVADLRGSLECFEDVAKQYASEFPCQLNPINEHYSFIGLASVRINHLIVFPLRLVSEPEKTTSSGHL